MPTYPAIRAKAATPWLGRVIHLVYPDANLLDIAGPVQVFHETAELTGGASRYEFVLVSPTGGPIMTGVGIAVDTKPTARVRLKPTDVVLVPGGDGVYAATRDARLVRWLRRAGCARILASTCTGAFLLGAAGWLDGRRAATHWQRCDRLQAHYPAARVESDPIFIEDGKIWTSAGVTSGIDLALAIVERDLGRGLALQLARSLVVHSKRPGGQSQFSDRLRQQVDDVDDTFEELHEWIATHLTADLRVERLAERAGMSTRNFHRAYTKHAGLTPARMISRTRVDAARSMLETGTTAIKTIARRCGFGTEEQMRRTFHRELGVSPSTYHATWSAPTD